MAHRAQGRQASRPGVPAGATPRSRCAREIAGSGSTGSLASSTGVWSEGADGESSLKTAWTTLHRPSRPTRPSRPSSPDNRQTRRGCRHGHLRGSGTNRHHSSTRRRDDLRRPIACDAHERHPNACDDEHEHGGQRDEERRSGGHERHAAPGIEERGDPNRELRARKQSARRETPSARSGGGSQLDQASRVARARSGVGDDPIVASDFAIDRQCAVEPPDGRVQAGDRRNDPLRHDRQIVAALDVRVFVKHDLVELFIGQAIDRIGRHGDQRTIETEHCRAVHVRGGDERRRACAIAHHRPHREARFPIAREGLAPTSWSAAGAPGRDRPAPNARRSMRPRPSESGSPSGSRGPARSSTDRARAAGARSEARKAASRSASR